MAHPSDKVEVYLEIGKKRTLAGAHDWPGWCRGGRDEEAALRAMVEYGPRYKRVLQAAGFSFHAPADVAALAVVERLEGNATTDFGVPGVAPASDTMPVDDAELQRLEGLLNACWAALDAAGQAAAGKELRKGPRGGGREREDIVRHVLDAEGSYVAGLGGKLPSQGDSAGVEETGALLKVRRQAVLEALGSAARGEFPRVGPRGGTRWTPRYFVRRAAWHILDHAWEIEDRAV